MWLLSIFQFFFCAISTSNPIQGSPNVDPSRVWAFFEQKLFNSAPRAKISKSTDLSINDETLLNLWANQTRLNITSVEFTETYQHVYRKRPSVKSEASRGSADVSSREGAEWFTSVGTVKGLAKAESESPSVLGQSIMTYKKDSGVTLMLTSVYGGVTSLTTLRSIPPTEGEGVDQPGVAKVAAASSDIWKKKCGYHNVFALDKDSNASQYLGDTFADAEASEMHIGVAHKSSEENDSWESTQVVEVAEGEADDNGNIVVDILMVCTKDALNEIEKTMQMSFAEYVEIQQSLLQSALAYTRYLQPIIFRVVTTWVTPHPFTTDKESWDYAKAQMTSVANDVGADLIVLYVNGGEYWGAGQLNGWVNVVDINAINGLLHSIGHNIGMNHCADDDSTNHKHGWLLQAPESNEILGTIMCKDVLMMYSNPDVKFQGIVAGDAEKADGKRAWREGVARLSGHRKHKVAFKIDTSLLTTIEARFDPTQQTPFEWHTPNTTGVMIVLAKHQDILSNFSSQFDISVQKKCQSEERSSKDKSFHAIIVDDPASGIWQLQAFDMKAPILITIELYQD